MRPVIRAYWQIEDLSLIDRALEIYRLHRAVSEFLGQYQWYIMEKDKAPVDIRDEQVVQTIIETFKKEIRRNTIYKNIPDDYVDFTASSCTFSQTKRYDDDALFDYRLGKKYEFCKQSSLQINRYHALPQLLDFSFMRGLVLMLVSLVQPYSVEVSDMAFTRDMHDIDPREYWFGWMTYLNKDVGLPPIPSGIEVEKLPDGGHLLITTQKAFSVDNPEHLAKAIALTEAFGIAMPPKEKQ